MNYLYIFEDGTYALGGAPEQVDILNLINKTHFVGGEWIALPEIKK